MTTVWDFPTRILFGEATTLEVGQEATKLGAKHALIVTDKGISKAGLLEPLKHSLAQAHLPFEIFEELGTNPSEEQVEKGVARFVESEAQIVISMGGGAAMDVGKLIRLRIHHQRPLAEYDESKGGTQRITEPLPPMIAIPTTAGTGSEVTRSALVSLTSTGKKTSISSLRLVPNVAVLDPSLTGTLPAAVAAATGFEALSRAIESYCALGDHPMADAIGLEAAGLVHTYFTRAVSRQGDTEARGGMLKAAMMGGVASQKGLGACHSLAQAAASEFDIHYGLASALCLPAVIDFNRSSIPVKVAHIARILGTRGDDIDTLAFECSGAIRTLRRKAGLPEGLSDVGIGEADIERLAAIAEEESGHTHNPRPCTREDLAALCRASL